MNRDYIGAAVVVVGLSLVVYAAAFALTGVMLVGILATTAANLTLSLVLQVLMARQRARGQRL